MISNRILVLLLLFLIIPAGFLFVFRSSLPFFLRRDTVPAGAYSVPWMTPTQPIPILSAIPPQAEPWNLSAVMQGSLRFDIIFDMALPNGTRTVASTIYLGHDQNLLYTGGIFRGMYSNPTSHWNPDNVTFHVEPNYFKILFDADGDGILQTPESGSVPHAAIPCPFNPSRCGLAPNGWGSADLIPGYNDLSWVNYVPEYGHGGWDLAFNQCNQPSTIAGMAAEYNEISGDLVMIFARHLNQPNSCANALQMKGGERWVMGFLFELGYQNGSAILSDYVDGWPKKAYPYPTGDASWWPKIAIDLSNPPPGF